MSTVEVRIDRSKPLLEDPATGHNRWHPDIPPIARCRPDDELILETRDALPSLPTSLRHRPPL